MNVLTGNKILVTADELEEGMIIPGKLFEEHKITHTQQGEDDILGAAVFVTVRGERSGNYAHYTFRPFDKLWIRA